MKPFRPAVLTATLLAFAGAAVAEPAPARPSGAAPINFMGFLVNPFCLAASDAPGPVASEEESDDSCESLLTECLTTWQMLCRSGLLDEAEDVVRIMMAMDPHNPKVHAASNVTRTLDGMRRMFAANPAPQYMPPCPWQGPAPASVDPRVQVRESHTGGLMLGAGVNSNCGVIGNITLTSAKKGCCADAQDGCCAGSCRTAVKADGCCAGGCCTTAKADPKAEPKNCGCKKGCACCDCGTAKGSDAPKAVRMPLPPAVMVIERHVPVYLPLPGPVDLEMALPPLPAVALPCPEVLPQPRPAVTVNARCQTMPGGWRVCEEVRCVQSDVVECRPVAHNAQHVHLATPHFEAHCERMSCQGPDRLLLEGDVRLTCKKHGQPLRIEAPRVLVDVRDGTFTVESELARPQARSSQFGAHRTGEAAYHPATVPAYRTQAECPEAVSFPPRPLPQR